MRRRFGYPWLVLLAVLGHAPLGSGPALEAQLLAEIATPVPSVNVAASLVIARVYFKDRADLDRLATELDALEHAAYRDGYLLALLNPEEREALVQAGYRVEVDLAQTAALQAQPAALAQTSGIPGYACYRTVEETHASVAQIASAHPNLARWIDIGDSWDKATAGGNPGYDLHVLVLTNTARPGPKPVFFLMAAIHAREYVTAELATRYAEHLVARYGHDPDVTWLLDHFEVHILPQANPDGRKIAEQGYYQRKNVHPAEGVTCSNPPSAINQHGVDLNRNSSFEWGGVGASTYACEQTYRGTAAASEPETAAIEAYVASIFPDQRGSGPTDAAPDNASGVFITLHSYSELVLYPWGSTTEPAPNGPGLETLGRKFGYFNSYEVCQPGACLYSTSGTTDDWAYGQLGVAAYTFELGTSFFQSCSDFENTILPDNLPALLYAHKAARRPYQAPAGPDSLHLAAGQATVVAGSPLTLTAVADDTRYDQPAWNSQAIAGARLSVDAPSWVTGAEVQAMLPADGAWDETVEPVQAVVDTTGWAPGRHLIFVESQDAEGNWGVPSAVFVQVQSPTYSAQLGPALSLAFGEPGEVVTHTLSVTNTGSAAAAYDVAVDGGRWAAVTPATVGPLAPGAASPLTVTVSISAAAAAGEYDLGTLTVQPQAAPSQAVSATLLTAVNSDYGLAVLPSSAPPTGAPGSLVTHMVRVVQLGSLSDSFTVTVTGNNWPAQAPNTAGPLARGESQLLPITVAVPAGAADGAMDTAAVTVASHGDSSQAGVVQVQTAAAWPRFYLPILLRQ